MKTKKKLYRVTLPWDGGDDAGDYCDSVWAKDEAAAIWMVAALMANSCVSELSDKERKKFIEGRVAAAGNDAVEDVAQVVAGDIKQLLHGPYGKSGKHAEVARQTIMYLLDIFSGST